MKIKKNVPNCSKSVPGDVKSIPLKLKMNYLLFSKKCFTVNFLK